MNKNLQIKKIRNKLKSNKYSIGTFVQINNADIVEIISSQGYDWIALDLEHGKINYSDLTNLFRSIEINNSIPLVRLGENSEYACKKIMDAGACGLIIPMLKNAEDLQNVINFSLWPPKGRRGVGYARANNYGKSFEYYLKNLSQNPLIIPMIENKEFVSNLEKIIKMKNIDAFFIGPYDLSASLGDPGNFETKTFKNTITYILKICKKYNTPVGIHIVEPNKDELKRKIKSGFQFLAYSLDTVFITKSSELPL